jgi:hypothetical protein
MVLRRRFLFAPVRLSSVTRPFAGLEYSFKLYELVKEYLPEMYQALLKAPAMDAAARFAAAFSKRYFPVELRSGYGAMYRDGHFVDPALSDFTSFIPLKWHGMKSWEYEAFNGMNRGQLLAEVICACPVPGLDRVTAVDRFINLAGDPGEAAAKLLPAEGWPLERVEEALAGSPYPGLLAWCRWLYGRTGNDWLDTTYCKEYWSRDTVDRLARAWREYPGIKEQMTRFGNWLGDDFPGRSAQVIKHIAGSIKRRPKTLVEVLGGLNDDQNREEKPAAIGGLAV